MEDETVRALRLELRSTPPVRFTLIAPHAYHIAALLQLACRHPDITQSDIDMVKAFIGMFGSMGPKTAEIIEKGWTGISEPGERRN